MREYRAPDHTGRTARQFRAFLVFSGAFNIALAAPLMVPELYRHYLGLLWAVNSLLGLGGQVPVSPPDGISALLINTAGIDLVPIGTIALWAARDSASRWFIPAINAVARTGFCCVIVYYVVVYDIARIILLIGLVDIIISGVFAFFLLSMRASPGAASAGLQQAAA